MTTMLERFRTTASFNLANYEQEDVNGPLQEFNREFTRKVLPVRIVFGLTACLGLVANVFVVYIYGSKYKRCNFKYFLFVMGVIGLVQCSIMLPTQVAEMHYWFTFPTSWLCRVSAYVFGYTVIACYCVLLLIAVDRFRKVCRPYGWQIQSNTARNLCVFVSFAALVFALPPGIISGHHKFVTSYKDSNITVTVCSTDDIFKDRDWAVAVLLVSGGLPVSIIILITCALYALILKQFYYGTSVKLKSLYSNNSSTRVGSEGSEKGTNPACTPDVQRKGSPTPPPPPPTPLSPTAKTDVQVKLQRMSTLQKVINSLLRRQGSRLQIDGSLRGPLKTSGNRVSRKGVRQKMLRKTLIVLIITITCIVALVMTFCLHTIAEELNNNIQETSIPLLNAFVIFHRGSFSIICAIFPFVYGLRDAKFRQAFRKIFTSESAHRPVTVVQRELSETDASKC